MTEYVLLTGASGGIGKTTALALSARGFTVFAAASSARSAAALDALNDSRIIPLAFDLSDNDGIEQVIADIRQRIGAEGHLHALVSNAGLDYNGPICSLTTEEIRSMVNVNLLGTILVTRASLPLMRAGKSRVIFIGSATGLMAPPIVTVYAATKWALEGLTDSLRLELGLLGISVSMIEPGVVQTPMTSNAPEILNNMLSRMDAQQRKAYEPVMRKIVHMSTKPGAGVTAEAVASVIERVVSTDKPKSRYRVGIDSKIVGVLRHLPDAMRDFLQRKSLGID